MECDRSASALPVQVGRRATPTFLRDRQELIAIFAGGFIGTVARGALARSVIVGPGGWPWATFAVNMLGAALLGYLDHASAGAPAAVALPARVAGHRAVRGV